MKPPNTESFLRAAGHLGVNQWVSISPVVSGTYKNSVMFKTYNSSSMPALTPDKGDGKAKGYPISAPPKDTVRIGINLVYANKIERLYGTGVRAMDRMKGQLNTLAKRMFG